MRTPQGPAHLFFGRTRRLVLGWLLTHPGDAYFLRQLARQLDVPTASAQQELDLLVKFGLITRVDSGHQVYFSANESALLYRELQSIFIKTTAVSDVLRDALRPVKDQVTTARLVGPAARGELQKDSAFEVVVIGTATRGDVDKCASRAQKALGRIVTTRMVPPSQMSEVLAEPSVAILGKTSTTATEDYD
jgi:hypothetical protein